MPHVVRGPTTPPLRDVSHFFVISRRHDTRCCRAIPSLHPAYSHTIMNENNNNNNRRCIRCQLRDVDYDDDDDDELEYGLRRTRRRTSYEHRGTSALSPAQVIDRDTYYGYASIAFMQSMYIYQLLLFHLVMYRYLQRCIALLMGSATSSIATDMQVRMDSIKIFAGRLIMLIPFTLAFGEICYLYVEDLTFFC